MSTTPTTHAVILGCAQLIEAQSRGDWEQAATLVNSWNPAMAKLVASNISWLLIEFMTARDPDSPSRFASELGNSIVNDM